MLFAATLAALLAASDPAAAAESGKCGGTKAVVGMTLGYAREADTKLRARSLEAISAIYVGSDTNVVGWLALDNRGSRWIQFGRGGEELRARLGTSVHFLDKSSLFSPVRESSFTLPFGFNLEPCSYVESLSS